MEVGLQGVWISKIISDSIITLYYFYVLARADWQKIGSDSVKRQVRNNAKLHSEKKVELHLN